jgi:2-polyprenyl-6-methoxyphenol hydroxylase-like FAD-dependent oxidoreductase
MTSGRLALLGDAAFVVRPHTAMGVAKAAGDAMALRSCLARLPYARPASLATKLPVLDKKEKSTLPRKERTMRTPETPAQSGRALNLTYRPEPIRVSVVLASNHVERKGSLCKFLRFYRENDLSI